MESIKAKRAADETRKARDAMNAKYKKVIDEISSCRIMTGLEEAKEYSKSHAAEQVPGEDKPHFLDFPGRKVVKNGIYRHFKGKYYLVEDIANNSETGEEMVVYRHLYGNGGLCVRPKEMFLSEVDHEKYPDVKQVYRFELVDEFKDEADGKPG
jgi:hypothetical protein